jgi:hypothetical protein
MHPTAIAQLTHSDVSFAHLATHYVSEIRRNLCVPEHADDDVEAEFVALRQRVDAHYPEFCALFAAALLDQLGPERLQQMLDGLNTEAAQRYLEVAVHVQLELKQSVPTLTQNLTAAARSALASFAPAPAVSSAQRGALRLARAAGVEGVLCGLAQAVTRQVLLEHGGNAADPQLSTSPEAQRLQELLVGMLAAFHARLFIRHVGEPHAAAVLAELERQPLRDYASTRSATRPAFDRALVSLTREIL